jgi:hypothetical protein
MRTENVELDNRFGEQYAGCYVFQEITWAKRSRIIQKHTKYHPLSGQIVSSDFVAIQAETIWASLKEQPASKPITLEKLLAEEDGIPIEFGEICSRVVNKLCSISAEEQRFLSEPSAEANHTQPSQNSGLLKNSGGPHCKSESSQPESSNNSSSS